jgi:Outer membrane receptor proteins, mostly Fe transport
MRKSLLLVAVCLFTFSASSFAQVQAGLAALSGTVQDASGASVPGAKVTVANESKGIHRNLETNADGIFTAPALVPAPGYSVTVEAKGFANYERKNIELLVGQSINLSIPLAVSSSTQTVDVTAGAPIVETTKTDVSQVVTTHQINDLPINGRRVDAFVLLTPGTVADGTFGLVSFRGIAGGNSFLTDGNDTTNTAYNENAGRTRISTQLSQDAVQEFQVLTTGYSAEYGRAAGGVINTVTRSGTNDLHGTGYWFFRNQDFNATDRYANGLNPEETRHQAGGSVGGHIIKDKLFYFFNTEITRRDFPLVNRLINPTFYDPSGKFIAPCLAPATPEQCTAAINFFGRQFQTLERQANSELLFGKIDWRPSDRNSVSASFNYLRWISPNGIQTQAVLTNGNGVGNNANSTVRTRYGRLAWTSIPSNNVVNEARFGWFKDRLFDDVNPALIPKETGTVGITVAGQSNLGTATDYPRLNPSEQRFQVADNLSWTVGRHSLKFGGDIVHTQDYFNVLRNNAGSYNYATLTNFALDFSGNTAGAKRWNTFSQTIGNPVLDLRFKEYSIYAQDQFRATNALTLNFGVRYEYSDLPQPTVINPAYPQTGVIHSSPKNFAPRFGFAYAFKDQKTALRGGYGIFYARMPGALIQQLFIVNGVYQPSVSLNSNIASDLAAGPVFPGRLPLNATNLPSGSVDLQFASKDFRSPYTQQGDLALERQLTENLGLTVSYVWSRGVGIIVSRDLNVGPLGPNVTYRIKMPPATRSAPIPPPPTGSLTASIPASAVSPRWKTAAIRTTTVSSSNSASATRTDSKPPCPIPGPTPLTMPCKAAAATRCSSIPLAPPSTEITAPTRARPPSTSATGSVSAPSGSLPSLRAIAALPNS